MGLYPGGLKTGGGLKSGILRYVCFSLSLSFFVSSFVFVPIADLSSRLYQFQLGVRALFSSF